MSTRNGLWGTTGLAFVGLFLGGLLFADVLAGRSYPGIDEPLAEITGYFAASGGDVRALSFFHSLAALSLLAFAAELRGFLARAESAGGRLSTLALGGGVMGATFLLLSALIFWALARPATAAEPALTRALFDLSYLAGGVALLLSLSALIGASSLLVLQTRALPAWIGWTGLVTAVISLLSAATMPAESGALGPGGIVVVAALPPFLWISAASIALLRASRGERRGAASSAGRREGATARA